MKKLFGVATALFMILSSANLLCFADAPYVNSLTYVVMEVNSGKVLASRGANTKMYPASITKILTCALALEHGSQQDRHTMTYKATHSIGYGTTHIALTEEEVVSVKDLLNATMIESANDAANGLAEYIAGDIDSFPDMMNEKCEEIGAVDSHFMNSHGLHDKQHYTTAYDMALITRWALGIDGFRELFGAESYTVMPTNKQTAQRNIGTHHMMLVPSKYYYEGTKGGKLGWTPEARHTMVTLAEKNGMELICVVMDTRTQYEKFTDTAKLFDYCFDNFTVSEINVNKFEDTVIPVYDTSGKTVSEIYFPTQPMYVAHSPEIAKIDISAEMNAPDSYKEGEEILATVEFFGPDGELLGSSRAQYAQREAAIPVMAAAPDAKENERADFDLRWLWSIPIIIAVAIVVLLLIRMRNLRLMEQRRLKKQRMKNEKVDRQIRESMRLTEGRTPAMKISFPHKTSSTGRVIAANRSRQRDSRIGRRTQNKKK